MKLRYFTYISDAKVDMLLPQIPHEHKEKIAAEVGVEFGFLKAKVSSETNTLESRVARLLVVERYLREHATPDNVGTPGVPRAWVDGSASTSFVNVGKGALLYVFSGTSWYFALAGSAKHLAGTAAPDEVDVPFSFLPDIVRTLAPLMQDDPRKLVSFWEQRVEDYRRQPIPTGFVDEWFRVVRYFVKEGYRVGTPQEISFFAYVLASQLWEGNLVTIASPLYIEMKR